MPYYDLPKVNEDGRRSSGYLWARIPGFVTYQNNDKYLYCSRNKIELIYYIVVDFYLVLFTFTLHAVYI